MRAKSKEGSRKKKPVVEAEDTPMFSKCQTPGYEVDAEGNHNIKGDTVKPDEKPKRNMVSHILDEHIRQSVERERARFAREADKMFKEQNRSVVHHLAVGNKKLAAVDEVIKELEAAVHNLGRKMAAMCLLNDLEIPDILKKDVPKAPKQKKKVVLQYSNLKKDAADDESEESDDECDDFNDQ